MSTPEEYEKEAVGNDLRSFFEITEQVLGDDLDERELRHGAYAAIGLHVGRLLGRSGTIHEALHKTYVDNGIQATERRVLIASANFPAHGIMHRIISNDEHFDPVMNQGKLVIQDAVVSTTQKTMSIQTSVLTRGKKDPSWSSTEDSGPILQIFHDSVRVVSGSDYHVRIPKTQGYPKAGDVLLAERIMLESIAEQLEQLDGVSQELHKPSEHGFMS